jgi:PRTRC genetic system protein B
LKRALLIYESRESAYVSSHPVMRSGAGSTLGAGRPLERSELEQLLERAGRDLGVRGWLAPEVLYLAPDAIAWWRPAASAPMFFKAGAIDKGARQGLAKQPGLVFAVRRGKWYVWAVKGAERPKPQTALFQAPYLNVYEDGDICVGDVKLPREISAATIDGFERAFFESRFTHENAGRLCTHKDGARGLWRDLLAGALADFPEDCLVPMNRTLADTVQRLMREEHDYDD